MLNLFRVNLVLRFYMRFAFTVPEEFQFDPVTKSYGDPSRRPEVRTSTIEFIAPSEYMVRNTYLKVFTPVNMNRNINIQII